MNNTLLKEQTIDTPAVLGRLLNTPSMQSLLALSRMEFVDSRYWWNGWNIMEVVNNYSREDFDAESWEIVPESWKYRPGVVRWWQDKGFIYDVNILTEEAQSWIEIRELFSSGLLHSHSITYIYSAMCEKWKISHDKLEMNDRVMFAYTEREMELFIMFWIPIFTFSSFINRLLDETLGKDISDPKIEAFIEEEWLEDELQASLRNNLVKSNNWYSIKWPRSLETHFSLSNLPDSDIDTIQNSSLIPLISDYEKLLEAINELWFTDSWQKNRFMADVLWIQSGKYITEWPWWKLHMFKFQDTSGMSLYDNTMKQSVPEDTFYLGRITFSNNYHKAKREDTDNSK